jgi:Tfp pilus assembly protein PilF
MLRATHAQSRVVYLRAAAFSILGSAIVLTAACGGTEQQQNGEGPKVPVTVATGETSLGQTSGDTPTPAEPAGPTVAPVETTCTIHDARGLTRVGRTLLEDGDARSALRCATRAVALDRKSHDAYRLMARAHAALNMPNEALAEYRIALSLDPEDKWSMNNLGLILLQQGQYEEALGPLARAVQLDSNVAIFQNNLGVALERSGHYALAALAYRQALRAGSSYVKARLSLARVDGRKEDPSVTPVELTTLASSFDQEVRTKVLSVQPVKKDTLPR